MQVMSYIYITDNLSLIHLRMKLLMRKVRLIFFLGGGGGGTYGSYIMAPLHNICILTQIRKIRANVTYDIQVQNIPKLILLLGL